MESCKTKDNPKDSNFDFKNSEFSKTLAKKHKVVKDKRIILFMKHVYLKNVVNLFQVSIIIASTIITFVGSMKPHIFSTNRETQAQIISICFSTYIAIATAIFKFLKIDDRKEEIYKMLQMFNDVETIINKKLKKMSIIQSQFRDEFSYYHKHKIPVEDISKNVIIEPGQHDEEEKRKIIQKYYKQYSDVITFYEQEDVEDKILEAKKQFHTMFSYNEIIYYRGKIVESMLLEKVHVGNRSILEAPMDEYKDNINYIEMYETTLDTNDFADISNDIQHIEFEIKRLKEHTKHIYNEDEFLYGSSWCNNICLYFSLSCHFCLVMNLYLSLAMKRSKFRSLKRKYDREYVDKEDQLRFLCCKFKAFDQLVRWCTCKETTDVPEDPPNIVYCCCEC